MTGQADHWGPGGTVEGAFTTMSMFLTKVKGRLFLYESRKVNSTVSIIDTKIASTYGKQLFAQVQALF